VQTKRETWRPNQWVPLFDGWRRAQGGAFGDQGAVVVVGDVLSLEAPAEGMAGVVCTYDVPATDYELRFEMRKNRGRDHAGSVVFPIGDRHCLWAINHGGRDFGLDLVDGKRDSEIGRAHRRYSIEDGRWYRCVLRVERRHILAKIDHETMIAMPTTGHVFSLWDGFSPAAPLGFVAANGTCVHVRGIRVRRLGILPQGREPVREFPGVVGDAVMAVERGDYEAAYKAMGEVRNEARRGEEGQRLVATASRALMRRAVAEARMLHYDRVRRLVEFAYRFHPETPDIRVLGKWAQAADNAYIRSDFSYAGLGGLKVVRGHWQKQDNELACRAPMGAVIMYDGVSKENFSFEADVTGGHGRQSLRFGLFFRSRRSGGRFLYFLVSDVEDRVYVGGGAGDVAAMPPPADGVEVRYAAGRPHYSIATGMTYHLQVICVGREFSCYVNGELVAEGTDDEPVSGRLGMLAHQADAHFDDVTIRNYFPMPELTVDYGDAPKGR
jgi:hypothetical protein